MISIDAAPIHFKQMNVSVACKSKWRYQGSSRGEKWLTVQCKALNSLNVVVSEPSLTVFGLRFLEKLSAYKISTAYYRRMLAG